MLVSLAAETLQLLLRNNEYCQYALSAGRVYDNFDDAEVKFNEVSLHAAWLYPLARFSRYMIP
eukprot:1140344-Pelagomonas_calceolata.AAC.10